MNTSPWLGVCVCADRQPYSSSFAVVRISILIWIGKHIMSHPIGPWVLIIHRSTSVGIYLYIHIHIYIYVAYLIHLTTALHSLP